MKKTLISGTIMVLMFLVNVKGQTTETKTNTQTSTSGTETITTTGTVWQDGTTTYVHTHTHTLSIPTIGGFKISANMSDFMINYTDDISSNMKLGVSAGFFLKFDISKYIALQYEIILHHKVSEMENKIDGTKFDYKYLGLEIPLYVVGQIQMGKGRGFIGAGPYVGLGLDAKYQPGNINLYKKDNTTDLKAMNRWDFGIGGIIGYEFNKILTISASYQGGFLNILDAGNDDMTMQNKTFSFGIGVRF